MRSFGIRPLGFRPLGTKLLGIRPLDIVESRANKVCLYSNSFLIMSSFFLGFFILFSSWVFCFDFFEWKFFALSLPQDYPSPVLFHALFNPLKFEALESLIIPLTHWSISHSSWWFQRWIQRCFIELSNRKQMKQMEWNRWQIK